MLTLKRKRWTNVDMMAVNKRHMSFICIRVHSNLALESPGPRLIVIRDLTIWRRRQHLLCMNMHLLSRGLTLFSGMLTHL